MAVVDILNNVLLHYCGTLCIFVALEHVLVYEGWLVCNLVAKEEEDLCISENEAA